MCISLYARPRAWVWSLYGTVYLSLESSGKAGPKHGCATVTKSVLQTTAAAVSRDARVSMWIVDVVGLERRG